MKLDVWKETHEAVREASARTGQSMSMIINLLVKYNMTDLLIDANVRKALTEFMRQNKKKLNLSKRQKKVIENAEDEFTRDLI